MDNPAIGPDAVKTGVTNDARFEGLTVEMHGLGHTCSDKICGRCSKSTAGPNFDLPITAGTAYNGEGSRPDPPEVTVFNIKTGEKRSIPRADYDDRNNASIAGGNVSDILNAVQEHEAGEACLNPDCERCNEVTAATLRRVARVQGGGSGSDREAKRGTQVCPVEGCGLTLCEHLAEKRRHAGGRKAEGPRPRVKPHTVKVSEEGKKGLLEPGAAQLIDELGYAVQRGLTIDEARRRLGVAQNEAA